MPKTPAPQVKSVTQDANVEGMSRSRSNLSLFAIGLSLGVIAGAALWGTQLARSRQALFHARPSRRLAAISHLRAHPSSGHARLLQEYVTWETHPLLRQRAQRVLAKMLRTIDRSSSATQAA